MARYSTGPFAPPDPRSPASEIHIRLFQPKDHAAVRDLFIRTNRELASDELRDAFEAYIARALETEIDRIAEYYQSRDGSFWIAENAASRLVGMYGLEKVRAGVVELRRMYVHHELRRRGIARYLLSHAEATCRAEGHSLITLSTSAVQSAAVQLYPAAGYKLVGEELATTASHKTVGAGMRRYYFEKALT